MIPTITVKMDVRCKRCGKKGATLGGYCMECVAWGVKKGKYDHIIKPGGKSFMRIGIETMGVAVKQIQDLLIDKKIIETMNQALINLEEEKLSATIKLVFEPGERKPIKVKTTISFPVDKYSRELKDEVDERQLSFLKDKEGMTA